MTDDTRYRITEGILAQPVGDGLLLLHPQTERLVSLNGSGARIWELLCQGASREGIPLQLAEELRKRDGDLPIVITTGHDPRAALVDREDRPFEVLRKPYSRAELKTVLLRNLRSM